MNSLSFSFALLINFILILRLFISFYEFNNDFLKSNFELLASLGFLVAIIFLIFYSSIKNNRSIIIAFALATLLLLAGFLFKVMHWPLSGELIIFGLLAIDLIYGYHFAIKSKKRYLDYLKLIWVLSFNLLILNSLFRFQTSKIFIAIEAFIFLLVFALFTYEKYILKIYKVEEVSLPKSNDILDD